jgi:hypothetical protein
MSSGAGRGLEETTPGLSWHNRGSGYNNTEGLYSMRGMARSPGPDRHSALPVKVLSGGLD